MDEDLEGKTVEQLRAEVVKLREGIRKHRDSSGHDLCWYHPELWNLLPDRQDPKPFVPSECEFLDNCKAYRKSLDAKPPA